MIFLKNYKKYIIDLVSKPVKINNIRNMYRYYYAYYSNFYCNGKYETEIEFNNYSELTKLAVRNKKGHCILYVECYPDYADASLPDDIEPDDRPWLYSIRINTKPPLSLQKLYNNPIKTYNILYVVAGEKITIARWKYIRRVLSS